MAKGWFGKTYDFFFGGENEEDPIVEESEERWRMSSPHSETFRPERETSREFRTDSPASRVRRDRERVLSLHGPPQKPTVEIHYPGSYDDAKRYGDLFKEGKMVTVDLESSDKRLRQQIIDFLSGVAYGLGGTAQKVNQNVFIFAPHHFEVVADFPPPPDNESDS